MNRIARIAGPGVLLLVAFVSLLVALVVGGGADAALIADPGAVVRFGLPLARMLVDLSAAATIGGLALATIGLSRTAPEWDRAIDVAAGAAGVWTVTAAVTTFFTYLSVAGGAVSLDAGFGQSMGVFLTGTDLGLAWLTTVLVAAVVTVLCFAVRSRGDGRAHHGGLAHRPRPAHAAGTRSRHREPRRSGHRARPAPGRGSALGRRTRHARARPRRPARRTPGRRGRPVLQRRPRVLRARRRLGCRLRPDPDRGVRRTRQPVRRPGARQGGRHRRDGGHRGGAPSPGDRVAHDQPDARPAVLDARGRRARRDGDRLRVRRRPRPDRDPGRAARTEQDQRPDPGRDPDRRPAPGRTRHVGGG
ncbi:hypothetical protein DEJ15_03965 [Curtobacterium sp. MCJR17_043]|nr:hypothetical protein [Curtobacterium sp. MCJR17_043]WIB36323.1 hypothetical protein DEJ15_03965 [Curtobacterium sp. MCJR17_043]